MLKKLLVSTLSSCFLLFPIASYAVPPDPPPVTGDPVIVQHLGKLEWPQDDVVSSPYLTQLVANDINDLHGNLSCELIISTPGNYHMALKDAMFGEPLLGHTGLLEQTGTPSQFKVSICWSTSPPVSIDQITEEELQFKNIKMMGRPSLVMAPGGVMDSLVANGQVDATSRQVFLVNQGNVMLVRADRVSEIKNVCDLGKPDVRVVTPHPVKEPGSFSNFSETIYNVANENPNLGCFDIVDDPGYPDDPSVSAATILFNSIYSQDIMSENSPFDLSAFKNPYNIDGVLSVFGRGTTPKPIIPKWIASSRIMHRDIPYALCHDEADVGIIFYHQAKYIMETFKGNGVDIPGCELVITPLDGNLNGTVPTPDLPGNRIGKLHIAKVNGSYAKKVNDARDILYDFFTSDPMWTKILEKHGMLSQ